MALVRDPRVDQILTGRPPAKRTTYRIPKPSSAPSVGSLIGKQGPGDWETVGDTWKDVIPAAATAGIGIAQNITDLLPGGGASPIGEAERYAQDYWAKRYSPEHQAELARQEQEKAAVGSWSEHPLDRAALLAKQTIRNPKTSIAEMVAQYAPVAGIGALAKTGALAAGVPAARAGAVAAEATGAALGVGAVRTGIYDTTYEALRKSGVPETEARARAERAQSYTENPGLFATAAVAGKYVAKFGEDEALIGLVTPDKVVAAEGRKALEDAAKGASVRGLLTGFAREAATEAPEEFIQNVASNVGAQRAGADVSPWEGAGDAAIKAGLQAGPMGAAGHFGGGRQARAALAGLDATAVPSQAGETGENPDILGDPVLDALVGRRPAPPAAPTARFGEEEALSKLGARPPAPEAPPEFAQSDLQRTVDSRARVAPIRDMVSRVRDETARRAQIIREGTPEELDAYLRDSVRAVQEANLRTDPATDPTVISIVLSTASEGGDPTRVLRAAGIQNAAAVVRQINETNPLAIFKEAQAQDLAQSQGSVKQRQAEEAWAADPKTQAAMEAARYQSILAKAVAMNSMKPLVEEAGLNPGQADKALKKAKRAMVSEHVSREIVPLPGVTEQAQPVDEAVQSDAGRQESPEALPARGSDETRNAPVVVESPVGEVVGPVVRHGESVPPSDAEVSAHFSRVAARVREIKRSEPNLPHRVIAQRVNQEFGNDNRLGRGHEALTRRMVDEVLKGEENPKTSDKGNYPGGPVAAMVNSRKDTGLQNDPERALYEAMDRMDRQQGHIAESVAAREEKAAANVAEGERLSERLEESVRNPRGKRVQGEPAVAPANEGRVDEGVPAGVRTQDRVSKETESRLEPRTEIPTAKLVANEAPKAVEAHAESVPPNAQLKKPGAGEFARDWIQKYAAADIEGRRALVKGLGGKLTYEDMRQLAAYTDDITTDNPAPSPKATETRFRPAKLEGVERPSSKAAHSPKPRERDRVRTEKVSEPAPKPEIGGKTEAVERPVPLTGKPQEAATAETPEAEFRRTQAEASAAEDRWRHISTSTAREIEGRTPDEKRANFTKKLSDAKRAMDEAKATAQKATAKMMAAKEQEAATVPVERPKPAPKPVQIEPKAEPKPTGSPERAALIDRIIEAAAAGRPKLTIHEIFELKGTDGKWYGAGGMPRGVRMVEPTEKRSKGFGTQNEQGIGVGVIKPTREAQEQRVREMRESNDAEFRKALEAMPEERLKSQAEYWLGTKPTANPRPQPKKRVWEQTQDEAVNNVYPYGKDVPSAPVGSKAQLNSMDAEKYSGGWRFKRAYDGQWTGLTDQRDQKRLDHQFAVSEALAAGQAVPEKVLREYPWLSAPDAKKTISDARERMRTKSPAETVAGADKTAALKARVDAAKENLERAKAAQDSAKGKRDKDKLQKRIDVLDKEHDDARRAAWEYRDERLKVEGDPAQKLIAGKRYDQVDEKALTPIVRAAVEANPKAKEFTAQQLEAAVKSFASNEWTPFYGSVIDKGLEKAVDNSLDVKLGEIVQKKALEEIAGMTGLEERTGYGQKDRFKYREEVKRSYRAGEIEKILVEARADNEKGLAAKKHMQAMLDQQAELEAKRIAALKEPVPAPMVSLINKLTKGEYEALSKGVSPDSPFRMAAEYPSEATLKRLGERGLVEKQLDPLTKTEEWVGTLTPFGQEVAKATERYDSRLKIGVPFSERESGKGRFSDAFDAGDKLVVGKVNGKDVHSSGRWIVEGPKPKQAEKHDATEFPSASLEKVMAPRKQAEQIRPVAYFESDRGEYIVMSNGSVFNARYFDYVSSVQPGASLEAVAGEKETPVYFKKDGKYVGAVMPVRYDLPVGAQAILDGDQVEEPLTKVEKPKESKIGDFGEKIGGARKDVWSAFQDRMKEAEGTDILTEPLSKVWPEPDYDAMLEGGADPWTVAFMHASRDEVPAKPRVSYRVASWAKQTKILRDMAFDLVSGKIDVADARKKLSEHPQLLDVKDRAELYQLVGHGKSLSGVRIRAGSYSLIDGVKYNPPKTFWTVEKKAAKTAFSNWPNELARAETREAAIKAFKEKYDSLQITPAANKTDFVVYTERKNAVPKFFVGKKLGRNIIQLGGPFETVKEARAYRNENHAALETKLEEAKKIPPTRRETNEPRVGEDMRNGQDVTKQLFEDSFGFRGVEFGNWVGQKKRQADLNDAFDALMDMAAILGVPPKSLSLNGELGLAFGARGGGGVGAAAAHYEPDKVVINITKEKGAGSIGHEWFHAVDNYFSRKRGERLGHVTESPNGMPGEIRQEMLVAFRNVMNAIKDTALKARSWQLDKKRSSPYWTTSHEMAARAYESYLISKLQDQNASNDYLANIVDEDTWKAAASLGFELDESYPYPTAGEIPKIREAFDNFFKTVHTKETDKGVAMFDRPNETTTEAAWENYNGRHDTTRTAPYKEAIRDGIQINGATRGVRVVDFENDVDKSILTDMSRQSAKLAAPVGTALRLIEKVSGLPIVFGGFTPSGNLHGVMTDGKIFVNYLATHQIALAVERETGEQYQSAFARLMTDVLIHEAAHYAEPGHGTAFVAELERIKAALEPFGIKAISREFAKYAYDRTTQGQTAKLYGQALTGWREGERRGREAAERGAGRGTVRTGSDVAERLQPRSRSDTSDASGAGVEGAEPQGRLPLFDEHQAEGLAAPAFVRGVDGRIDEQAYIPKDRPSVATFGDEFNGYEYGIRTPFLKEGQSTPDGNVYNDLGIAAQDGEQLAFPTKAEAESAMRELFPEFFSEASGKVLGGGDRFGKPRFARKPSAPAPGQLLEEETNAQRLQRGLQDRLNRLSLGEVAVNARKGITATPSLANRIYGVSPRVENAVSVAEHSILNPILEGVKKNGLDWDLLGDYAKGDNDAVAKVAASGKQALYDAARDQIKAVLDRSDAVRLATGLDDAESIAEAQKKRGPTGVKITKEHPLYEAVRELESSIFRAEHNRAMENLADFVEKNGVPEFGRVRQGEPSDGPNDGQNSILLKRNGETWSIDLADDKMAEAIKKLNTDQLDVMTRTVGAVTRWVSRINTLWSPTFTLKNKIRDVGNAVLSSMILNGAPNGISRSVAFKVAAGQVSAWKGTREYMKNPSGKFQQGSPAWWAQQAHKNAAVPGYFKSIESIDRIESRLGSALKASQRQSALRDFGAFLMGLAQAGEASTRVSVYRALVEEGMSPSKAGDVARGTLDVNKRGEWAKAIGAFSPFFNSSAQGTARLVEMVRSPDPVVRRRAQATMASMVAGGLLMGSALAAWGGDDDQDEVPDSDQIAEWDTQRNLLIPWLGGTRLRIPLPQGFSAPFYAGFMLGKTGRGNATAKQAAGNIGVAFYDQFAPISSPFGVAQPLADIARNEKFSGAPIRPIRFPGQLQPNSQMAFKSTSGAAKSVAAGINRLTGGDDAVPGLVDLSPGDIEYLAKAGTGGLGKFLSDAYTASESLVRGETPKRVPLISDFVTDANAGQRARFYEQSRDVDQAESRLKLVEGAVRRGVLQAAVPGMDFSRTTLSDLREATAGVSFSPEQRARFRSQDRALMALKPMFDNASKVVKAIDAMPNGPEKDAAFERIALKVNRAYQAAIRGGGQ